MSMLLQPTATLATIFSFGAASIALRSMASASRQTSASLSATRARSSAGGIAASPLYRSTSATACSLPRTDDGSLRVTRMAGIWNRSHKRRPRSHEGLEGHEEEGQVFFRALRGSSCFRGCFSGPVAHSIVIPLPPLVSQRQAIAAMGAADRRLDETRPLLVAARERQPQKRRARLRRTGR